MRTRYNRLKYGRFTSKVATKLVYYIGLIEWMADSMQFNLEGGGGNAIQRREGGAIEIGGKQYNHSLIIFPDGIVADWSIQNVADLSVASLQSVIAAKSEVFLLGTGDKQVFPPMSLLAALVRANRSVDVMDTAAACRTYNVLISEFRQVVVALILS